MAKTHGQAAVEAKNSKAHRLEQCRLQRLEDDIAELKRQISRQSSLRVPIQSFAPEPFELIKPFDVIVQPSDDEYLASFFDANINASGCTETDAVANLKSLMTVLFERFLSLPPSKLGPGPSRQLAVLKEFIKRKK